MSLATRLLGANPGAQVSSALTGALTTPSAKGSINFSIDYLVVAGGGGGGWNGGGGGGAGGLVASSTGLSFSTAYTVTIGAGGAGGILGSSTPAVQGN